MRNIDQNTPAGKDHRPIITYEPNRQELARFVRILFRKTPAAKGFVKLSAFLEDDKLDPHDTGKHKFVSLRDDGPEAIIEPALALAEEAANDDPPRVFCPPPSVFRGMSAKYQALQSCPALFVDADKNPDQAQRSLEALLGAASLVVLSGGEWTNPETGEHQAKKHLYWVLSKRAEGPDELIKLETAQRIAIALVDGDLSITPVHAMRWPGSWHRKTDTARLCKIASWHENEIDLDTVYDILIKAAYEAPEEVKARIEEACKVKKSKANGKAGNGFDAHATDLRNPQQRVGEWRDLIGNVLAGVNLHDSLRDLSIKLLCAKDDRAVRNVICGLMEQTPAEQRDGRWQARYDDIPRAVSTARAKVDTAQAEDEEADIQPIDLWGHFDPPPLPRDLLPKVIEDFAFTEAQVMGADPAGLAMAALTVCAGAITDDIKLQVKQHSSGWTEHAGVWTALISLPSGMKSPIIRAAERPLKTIDTRLMHDYLRRKADYDALPKDKQKQEEPPRREQLRLEDTTIESAQDTMRYNSRGMLLVQDEISGWIGGMEKYSNSGRGAGKDRGFWLISWNGGSLGVGRVNRGSFNIPNVGTSLLGGVQPDVIRKLAGETYDDGLIQRLLPIVLRPAVDGTDEPAPATGAAYDELIEQLYKLTQEAVDVTAGNSTLRFDDNAQQIRQQMEKKHRERAQSLEAINKRLAAHVGKYAGYFARLCLVFHCIENVGKVRMPPLKLPSKFFEDARAKPPEVAIVKLPGVISEDTAKRVARFIDEFLFPHAVAFYTGVLSVADGYDRVSAVAGYILAHGLEYVSNRDIARSVHDMRGLDRRQTETVFEQLDALGWVFRRPGPRLSSPPRWKINPAVHRLFAQRGKDEIARRRQAQKLIAAEVAHIRETGAKPSTAKGGGER